MNAIAIFTPPQASPQTSRLIAFEQVVSLLPINEYGLPAFLYRPDLIPPDFATLQEQDRQEHLKAAALSISYREGYPTFDSGIPFWGKMEQEQDEDFALFQEFLNLAQVRGYRQLADLHDRLSTNNRTTNYVFATQEFALEDLRSLFGYNYWAYRAKAYDLFRAAAQQRLREQRIMSIEDVQHLRTERLISRIEEHVELIMTPEKLEALEPKEYIALMDKLHDMQRKALGLNTGKGATSKNDENAPPPNASMEVTIRSLAKQSKADQVHGQHSEKKDNLDLLLEDGDTATMAQELIIRVATGKNSYRKPEIQEASLESDLEADQTMLGQN